MDIKEALKRWMLESGFPEKIYYTKAPTKTPAPYGVISIIDAQRENTHDGRDGLTETLIQVDWFVKRDTDASRWGAKTIALAGIKNTTLGGSDGVFVAQIEIADERDAYEDDTGLHHKMIDLNIQYREVK